MPIVTLSINVKHNAPQVEAQLREVPSRLTRATRDFVEEGGRLLKSDARDAIEEIAGGVYWDIHSETMPTPEGARAIVSTAPSKPHRIEPKDKKALHFEMQGREVFAKGVNHPGSKPVDWPDHLARSPHPAYRRLYAQKVGAALGGAGGDTRSAMPVGGL